MSDKLMRIQRAVVPSRPRPVLLAVAGDSASGKTTLAKGIVQALGPERSTSVCVDDYHRYDRVERRNKPFTALHPDCNYIEIMEQHLQLLASGKPILKPVYDHPSGQLVRPELVEPRDFIIVEGLLPLHTKLMRACFDVTVYLDPPEEIRRPWKIDRDVTKRGYSREQVLAELAIREPESEQFVRPQRADADIVVRFAPVAGRGDPPDTPLSAELLLRPTIRHPDLTTLFSEINANAMHLKLIRDEQGRPVDALHVHGYVPPEESQILEKAIWARLSSRIALPDCLGQIGDGRRSAPLAVTQLLLLSHLLDPS
jgi:phosphoribulokinase